MRNENVFNVKVISYEKLYSQFCNHKYKKDNEIPSVTLKELVLSQKSAAEQANLFEENGLFYQIEFVKGIEPSNKKDKPNVLNEIIFIDFKSDIKDFLNKYKVDILYLFEKGFRVYLNDNFDKLIYEFVPFEKSASMGKDSKISFISKIGYDGNDKKIDNFYEKIINRSYLGLTEPIVYDGSNGYVPLAKRYAYRGLLLSTGKRVTNIDIRKAGILPKFKFNKQNVLLVQDIEDDIENGINYFTQKVKDWNDEKTKLKFEDIPDKKTTNGFKKCINDGYGFISDELADSIDIVLSKDNKINKHSSYQIRLPYVKGMVHRINYKDFFARIANEKGEVTIKSYDENLERSTNTYTLEQLNDVQLIITKSMFKAMQELRQFKKNNPEIPDAIEYYFDQLNKYYHSLFILNMDKSNGEQESETTWNYQYISTVDLGHEEFDELYNYSKNIYTGLKNDLSKRIDYICSKDKVNNEEDIEESVIDEEDGSQLNLLNSSKSLETKLLSLSIKDDLIKEPYFKELLNKELSKMADNFGIGRIIMSGQDRFILGDPLKYLYCITCNEDLFNEPLPDNSFYMPGIVEDDNIKEGKLYPVLRNPHLCRNEDLLLKIHFPKKDSLRYKYLSNLTGTVIIDSTHSSIPAETLQGCDFDGDHAKIYFNDIYSNAILKNRVGSNDDGLPIVINDKYKEFGSNLKEDYIDNNTNRYKVSMNTFSSSIGQISNLAFIESLTAYSNGDEAEESKNKLRLLAILTGVEADSPKTGIKPYFSSKCDESKKDFIRFKSSIKDKTFKIKEVSKKYKSGYNNNVERLITKHSELLEIKSIRIKRNENMLEWAKPKALDIADGTNTIYKGDKYYSVLNLINAYNRIVNEENSKLNGIENKGLYYEDLVKKSEWFDIENGRNRLFKLIKNLSDESRVPYLNFYSLYNHCTRKVLLYKYYPYFSNPFNDYDKSISYARKWLVKTFTRFKVNVDEDDYDLILSDAKFFYQLINNVKDIRYSMYEDTVTLESLDDMKHLIKTELIDSTLSNDELETEISEYENRIIDSISICKSKINDCLNNLLENKYGIVNLDTNLTYNKYLMLLIRRVYNCECLNVDINLIIKENVKQFFENLKNYFRLKIENFESIINNVSIVINNYLIKTLAFNWYQKDISIELIKLSNNYRLTESNYIEESHIELYNELKNYIKSDGSYWKVALKNIVIKKLKQILNPSGKHTVEEVEEMMIIYTRACEEEADKNQKFLMNVLGDIYYKVLLRKEGNNND